MLKIIGFLILLLVCTIQCWEALPQIPTGRRTQYLVLHENGGYKYGYDTGDGSAAEQSGDDSNQVEGRYLYDSPSGQKFSVKYTAGVQGFVPEGIPQISSSVPVAPAVLPITQYSNVVQDNVDQAGTGDASYSFNIDTDSYKRQETSDASGNVKGRYSYNNAAGTHDLTYVAGENTGFVAVSGSLATPNGLASGSQPSSHTYIPAAATIGSTISSDIYASPAITYKADGSYSFGYSNPEASQQQSGDANGNVKGSYSYRNSAGTHDLSYVAGSDTGFVSTGGSLSQLNGLRTQSVDTTQNSQLPFEAPNQGTQVSSSSPADGSYEFKYSNNESSRKEIGDANGNIKGSYSYKNSGGTHDLSYVAGSDTGFVATGGSLSQPNGLRTQSVGATQNSQLSFGTPNQGIQVSSSTPVDGSYEFEYSNSDSSRKEAGDANGNVKGSYSYRNEAGNHDLSYIAGSSTGFQATGGSLSVPNGLGTSNPSILAPTLYNSPPSSSPVSTFSSSQQADLANTGDSSYSFTFDTDTYKRTEASDASGNVQGSYSYKNAAGTHDLSFVAGSATGFQPTGGSLSSLNAVPSSLGDSSRSAPAFTATISNNDNDQSTGDASYNFSFDTDDYKRAESADANGNVIGSFSYKNSFGQHDLSYEAGGEKGFRTTGGSLSIPPGLNEAQFRSQGLNSYDSTPINSYSLEASPVLPSTKNTYRIGNVVVNSYLPPSNEKRKFGYIFDTKY